MSAPAGAQRTVDAEAVASAVAGCPSVAHLVGGPAGAQVATLLPGRRIVGVRVTDDRVEVHIASRWGVPIREVSAEVRTAVAPHTGSLPVIIAVDDIDDPRPALPAGDVDASPDAPAGSLPPGGGPIAVPSPS